MWKISPSVRDAFFPQARTRNAAVRLNCVDNSVDNNFPLIHGSFGENFPPTHATFERGSANTSTFTWRNSFSRTYFDDFYTISRLSNVDNDSENWRNCQRFLLGCLHVLAKCFRAKSFFFSGKVFLKARESRCMWWQMHFKGEIYDEKGGRIQIWMNLFKSCS